MELAKEAYVAVSRYFSRLANFGYIPDVEVEKVIALLAIKDLVNRYLLNEQQYRIVENALTCLWGTSCMLPYPEYIKQHSMVATDKEAIYRFTEEGEDRITEDDRMRVVQ